MKTIITIFFILILAFSSCTKEQCGKCRLANGDENGVACATNDPKAYKVFKEDCASASGTWIEVF